MEMERREYGIEERRGERDGGRGGAPEAKTAACNPRREINRARTTLRRSAVPYPIGTACDGLR